jgi:coenzyme F420 hydrogenase subunit beta
MANTFGLDELSRRVLDKGLCAACGACCEGCPYLTAFKGKTVVLDKCTIEHGRCFQYCPMTFFNADDVSQALFGVPNDHSGIGHYREVVASRATDRDVMEEGQGGGTVSAFMSMALESGIIDCAILTGGNGANYFPRGIVATSADQIMSSTGSKFVGAHSLVAFREALNRDFRAIGVVGLPCQVRSLRKMAFYDLKKEGIADRLRLVVGLFCNWAFSSRDFTSFLSKRMNLQEIKGIHIPPPPADQLEIRTTQGLETVPLNEVRPLIQAACHVCPDMTAEYSDLSVGMYEGRDNWNTLVVRTDTGHQLMQMGLDTGKIQIDVFPQSNLEHLKGASIRKKERAAAQADQ